MNNNYITPDYVFETSWEVCNKVGGIYTVLSTRASVLQQRLKDHLIFLGPDLGASAHPDFTEDIALFADWKEELAKYNGIKVRSGRWNVPGSPIALLVDFSTLHLQRNNLYRQVWEWYGVDSLHAYGDYHDSAMFGYAVGIVIDSYYRYYKLKGKKVIAHFNEWMTTFGLFFLKRYTPEVATIFTTHATSIGRSIAGNHKPLYDYLAHYDGDQMADELNMQAKHSVEKQAAHYADCFTTVSDITARECTQLLGKTPDVVTPNGFEDDFVPTGKLFNIKKEEARNALKKVAECLLTYQLPEDTLFVATGGRYEFLNKGLDVFIDSLKRLESSESLSRTIVAFLMVPAYISGPRKDLQSHLSGSDNIPHGNPFVTHQLVEPWHDPILSSISWSHLTNAQNTKVKIIFVPSYLTGDDGIFNKSYYDLLIGTDLTVFPSYYEPWGYTPLESSAFSVPTITTSLSGFGQWVNYHQQDIDQGVAVIPRNDSNYNEVVSELVLQIEQFAALTPVQVQSARKKAATIAEKALWEHFIEYYDKAYTIALSKKR
ncbi:MAG: glycogen/starch synthase [Bacteroidota bacterium]|nr:glycogen/starch synthase [Bacteroidota bacterium]